MGIMTQAKKICQTPTTGKSGTTRIPLWKYTCVREAILAAIDAAGSEGILFKDLGEAVRVRLTPEDLNDLGSLMWHVTTVKLDMEVEGDIIRAKGQSPQRVLRA